MYLHFVITQTLSILIIISLPSSTYISTSIPFNYSYTPLSFRTVTFPSYTINNQPYLTFISKLYSFTMIHLAFPVHSFSNNTSLLHHNACSTIISLLRRLSGTLTRSLLRNTLKCHPSQKVFFGSSTLCSSLPLLYPVMHIQIINATFILACLSVPNTLCFSLTTLFWASLSSLLFYPILLFSSLFFSSIVFFTSFLPSSPTYIYIYISTSTQAHLPSSHLHNALIG